MPARVTSSSIGRKNEDRVIFVPTEASDAAAINEIMSQAIDQILADQRLLDFLAAPTGQQSSTANAAAAPTGQ